MDRVALKVLKSVVHPSHVPLEIKSKSALSYIAGHPWPCGRLLRDRYRTPAASNQRVEILQQTDEFDIFSAAEMIGDPFIGWAAIIAVKHRRHRIDAQSIYMKCIDPPKRGRNQKTANFAAASVINKCVPVAVKTLARILMFVKRGTVKPGHAMLIRRKMRRHPVEDYSDPIRVAAVDKAGERVRRP